MSGSINTGFRWLDDISIKLINGQPSVNATLQLKIYADVEKKYYTVTQGRDGIIRRDLNERIPCDKSKKIVVKLYEHTNKLGVMKGKKQILLIRAPLEDSELYVENTHQSANGEASAHFTFAYSHGGTLREHIESARRTTEEQKAVLDRIKRIHRFFQHLEALCNSIKEVHQYIEAGCSALLLLYRLCEKQKKCRDAARSLVKEMDDLLNYGVEELSGVLKENSNTRIAFKSLVEVIADVAKFISDEDKEIFRTLVRDAFSADYELRIEKLRERFGKAKDGLKESIMFGIWELVTDDKLERDLKSVPGAHYERGAGCLPGTRVDLLTKLDRWVRDPVVERIAWVHGYAGSGKSALLNSLARLLEKAGIPFSCFVCKGDDAERSNVHRILPTLCYDITKYYGDYRGTISNTIRQQASRSIFTGDIAAQMELLFGESPSYEVISPESARRPPIHVILIDALDECKDIRKRSTLAKYLRDLAASKKWIKVLIASRREPDINKVLGGASSGVVCIDINDTKWNTDIDIHAFVEAKSQEMNLNLSASQIRHLVEKASGLFVWCATVFRYIENRRSPAMDTIDTILGSPSEGKERPFESLYRLYQRVLDSAASDNEDKALVELVLSVIFVASSCHTLSADAIADILYPKEHGNGRIRKREWVGNIIAYLSAIIYVEEGTGFIRACHPSVLDFIAGLLAGGFLATTAVSGELLAKPFLVQLEDIHVRLFNGCFTLMNRDLRFNMCNIEDPFRLNKDIPDLPIRINQNLSEALKYGIMFWISHLQQSGLRESGELIFAFLSSLKALFWVEGLSLLDIVDQGIIALQDCALFFIAEQKIVDIASEWERFLLAYGDAGKSTPHVYLSALSWLPDSSRLRDIVRGSFSSELPMISNVQKAWGAEKWSENVGAEVMSVSYSPNGRFFAAGCEDGRVLFWEARSGKKIKVPSLTESPVNSIAFSPDNRWVALGNHDGNIRLWELHDESAAPRVLEGHTDAVNSVVFSLDGKRIVSGSTDKSIIVWNTQSGTVIGEPFRGHLSYVSSATFFSNDERIASGSWDNSVRIWDSKTGEQFGKPLIGHSSWVSSVACSRDGKLIASGSADMTVRLWDAQTHEQIGESMTCRYNYVNSVCFSMDSKYIASGSDDFRIRIWNVETLSLAYEMIGHTGLVSSVTFSPDGRSILSGSCDGTTRIWNIKGNTLAVQPSIDVAAKVLCVSYVPDKNLIVSGLRDGTIYLWDACNGVMVGEPLRGHTDEVSAVAISGDSQWLVSGSVDKTLRFWDIASGATLGEPMLCHTEGVLSVAVSPNNKLVASASTDHTARLWDVASRKLLMTLVGHEGTVASVAFSMDGNRIITGSSDRSLRVWDTHTGGAIWRPLIGHSSIVNAVALSADGAWIASVSDDRTWCIWDMSTHSWAFKGDGYYREIISVAFSPNSQFLAIGFLDGIISVCNVETGEVVGNALTGHSQIVHSVAFSPSGHEFASGSEDGTIRVWDARVRTDITLHRETEASYPQLGEKDLRIRWNTVRSRMDVENDAWVRDGEKLLLWVPWQYRRDINGGTKLVIGAQVIDTVRPEVDYRKVFRYSGTQWTDIYTADR